MKKLTALLLAAVLVLALSGCTVETLGDWGGIGGMKAGETSASETAEASKEAEDPQADDEDAADPEVTDTTDPAEDEEGDPAEETDGEAGETNDETTGETEESSDEENESEESSDAAEEEGADESTDGSADESTDEPEGPSEEEVFAAFADVIAELEEQCGEGEIREPEEEEDPAAAGTPQNLLGETIVITGSLNHFSNRKALQAEIEARGGKVTGSVTSKTTMLINNDATSSSAKNKAAGKLGIPILTEEEFLEKAGIPV